MIHVLDMIKVTAAIAWRHGMRFRLVVLLLCSLVASLAVQAFPEYQTYIRTHSGRPLDCGMCHTHPEGPTGSSPGQIGHLTDEEMERLNLSRAALQPGPEIDNPVLNAFGNKIVARVGMAKCLEFQEKPAGLAPALDQRSDLDKDGIPDAQEMLGGTNPLDQMSGDPWRLFAANLLRTKAEIISSIFAVFMIVLGLRHFLLAYHKRQSAGTAEPVAEEAVTIPEMPTDDEKACVTSSRSLWQTVKSTK